MKLSFFITCLLFFTVNYVLAQTDSLTTKSFEELEKKFLSTYTNPAKAKKYVDALYIVAQKGTDKQRIAKALYRKGSIYSKLGNIEDAFSFAENSSIMAQELGNKTLVFQNYILKGNIYLTKGDYTKTIDFYLKAKSLAEERQNLTDILAMSYNIGLVKKQIGDYKGALEEFKQNLQKVKSLATTNQDRTEVINCLGISDTYLRMQQPDIAYVYICLLYTSPSPRD